MPHFFRKVEIVNNKIVEFTHCKMSNIRDLQRQSNSTPNRKKGKSNFFHETTVLEIEKLNYVVKNRRRKLGS